MARTPSLASLSVGELLKLRDEVGKVLSQKAAQLEEQLSMLGGEVGTARRGRRSAMKGRKVAVIIATRKATRGPGEGRSQSGYARGSRRARNWRILPFNGQQLPARFLREKQRSADVRSDEVSGCGSALGEGS
jgi:hypothetical protein